LVWNPRSKGGKGRSEEGLRPLLKLRRGGAAVRSLSPRGEIPPLPGNRLRSDGPDPRHRDASAKEATRTWEADSRARAAESSSARGGMEGDWVALG
jgi:hypothetical protein